MLMMTEINYEPNAKLEHEVYYNYDRDASRLSGDGGELITAACRDQLLNLPYALF